MRSKTQTISFTGQLYTQDLQSSLNQLSDRDKAKFALDLGENGDLSYELYLLQLITDLTINEYSDIADEKDEMYNVIQTLQILKNNLKFLDSE